MSKTTSKPVRPFFKALSDEALVAEYVGLKALAYNGASMRWGGLGGCLKDLDLVIAIARKRGLALPV